MEYINFKKGSKFPQKRGGSSLHSLGNNKFILIGGGNRTEEFGDIWELTILKENECEWKKIDIPLSSFTPRTGHTSAQVDESSVYIYGGQNFSLNKHYDDFLHLDLDTNTIERLNKQNNAINLNVPTERNSSTLVYNPIDKQLLLFGGADSQEPLKDLFIYDICLGVWKRVETKNGDDIKGLEMHTAHFYSSDNDLKISKKKKKKSKAAKKQQQQNIIDINIGDFTKEIDQSGKAIPHENIMNLPKVNIEFDEKNAIIVNDEQDEGDDDGEFPPQQSQKGNEEDEEEEKKIDENEDGTKEEKKKEKYMIVIGGRYLDKIKSDVYALNLTTFEWKRIKELPFNICAHASAIVDDAIYIYGGTSGLEFFDKLLILQLTNQKLYEFEITPEEKKKCLITPKMASAMTYDPETKNIYIFGGAGMEDESTTLFSVNTNKINTSNRTKKI